MQGPLPMHGLEAVPDDCIGQQGDCNRQVMQIPIRSCAGLLLAKNLNIKTQHILR